MVDVGAGRQGEVGVPQRMSWAKARGSVAWIMRGLPLWTAELGLYPRALGAVQGFWTGEGHDLIYVLCVVYVRLLCGVCTDEACFLACVSVPALEPFLSGGENRMGSMCMGWG